MLLLLTSVAAETLDTCLPYLPGYRPAVKVAFIPTAAGLEIDAPWQTEDRNKLEELGFQVLTIDIKDKTSEQLRSDFVDIDILFVAGGNTFYLLEQAKKSGFLEVAKELITKGVIYIGSSAGSVLVAPNIESVQNLDDSHAAALENYEAMNIVDFVVLPHYHKDDPVYKEIIKTYYGKYNLLPLTDQQFVLVTDEGYKVIQ